MNRLVQIHPFPNGNGRWARLITNIFLKKRTQEPIHWPEETLQEVSPFRRDNIAALRAADQGNFQALQVIYQNLV